MSEQVLAGKVAVVTGASSGIGARMALALAGAGARVVLVARRASRLAEVVGACEAVGAEAAPFVWDLSEPSRLEEAAAQALKVFGAADIVVHAAGVNLRQPADEVSVESWQQTLNLNLTAPFFFSRPLVAAMKARGGGKIINIASLQSTRAFANSVPYGASKGGVMQLTRAMAQAWGPDGVCVNAIAPGFFPTELTEPVFSDPARAAAMASRTFFGRNGRLDDLDGATIFLASAASDFVTGQTLFVDGGFSAG